jgi:hypothetical protein
MFCRNCGKELTGTPEICVGCGAKPLAGNKFCQACGAQTDPIAEICIKCGVRLQKPAKASTGLEPNVAGLLCYLVGWITGLVFILIEKENQFVRFHAMQSIIIFGWHSPSNSLYLGTIYDNTGNFWSSGFYPLDTADD